MRRDLVNANGLYVIFYLLPLSVGNASEAPSSKPYNVHSVTRRSAVRAVRKQRFVGNGQL